MNREPTESLRRLLERRLTRRGLVQAGGGLAAFTALAPAARAASGSPLGFEPIAPSRADGVVVPEGYEATVVVRWGDPLVGDVEPLEATRVADGALLDPGAAERQARWFGMNCDGVGLFELDDDRLLVCVNHEYPDPVLMFPGMLDALREDRAGDFVRRHPETVRVMKAAVGLSVVELERSSAGWRYVPGSGLNRRVTADTPIELSGPARGLALLGASRETVHGTFGNCAAGTTPWGTYLTAEENTDDMFGNAAAARFDAATARAHARFGARRRESAFRWEHVDERFDMAVRPREPLGFGWIVEIDPRDAQAPLKKRTALGRFKHEGATTVLAADGRAVVYMGDDEAFEYLYKFVSRATFEPERPEANRDLLDEGTLYVARFGADGAGEWIPLVFGEHAELSEANGFTSQADVVLLVREAADRVGATPMDRPEDVAVSPVDGCVYVACTQNAARGAGDDAERAADAANARAPNPYGHIIELAERDAAATTFEWTPFILAGRPEPSNLLVEPLAEAAQAPLAPDTTLFGGFAEIDALSAFANPDNLEVDADGNLWIVTDGDQPGGYNNGCFVCPTRGPHRGAVRQFMSGPVGAEICGCEITDDGRTLFLTVQHPGVPGTPEAPASRWPDGGAAAPRASLVAIESNDRARRLGG